MLLAPNLAVELAARVSLYFYQSMVLDKEIEAANSIVAYLTDPKNDLLLTPDAGRHVDLIGHSFGAEVDSIVSQKLTKMGYTVDQYTALDGFGTDWPGVVGEFIGSVDPVAATQAQTKVNFQVQNGFYQAFIEWLAAAIGSPLPPVLSDRLRAALKDQKAPERGGGFENYLVVGDPNDPEDPYSDHRNILRLISGGAAISGGGGPAINKTFVGRHKDDFGSLSGSRSRSYRISGSPETAESSPGPDLSNFTDGSFENLGRELADVQALNFDPGDDALFSAWLDLVSDPAQLLGAEWNTTGDARLVQDSGNSLAELTLANGTSSIGQFLELDNDANSVNFDLSVSGAKPGDQLQVLLDQQVISTIDLSTAAASARLQASLSGLSSRTGNLTFQLSGPSVDKVRIRLDRLAVNESSSPLTIDPIMDLPAVAGTRVSLVVTANDSDPAGELTFSLGPGAPADAKIDPVTGSFSWPIPSSTPQGDNPITVIVTDNAVPSHSISKTFQINVLTGSPTVILGSNASITVGAALSQSGSFVDIGVGPFTATADYGDGSGAQSVSLNPDQTFVLGHTYSKAGHYTVTVSVVDQSGGVGQGTFQITVSPKLVTVKASELPRKNGATTGFVLALSGSVINAGSAKYSLTLAGKDKKFGTADDVVIALTKPVYDRTHHTITLKLRKRLVLTNLPVRLTESGLIDATKTAVDGDGDGKPGGTFVAFFDKRGLLRH
jgi:hypothetical protein